VGSVSIGDRVTLDDEDDAIVPAGRHIVSKVNEDGSFHVGGNTAVWPRRILSVYSREK
jgi:hypothetical protein